MTKYHNYIYRKAVILFILMGAIMISHSSIVYANNTTPPDSQSTEESPKRKVRIGYAESIGYYQNDDKGNYGGVGHDYENILAQYANWDIEYVEDSWVNLNQMLAKGEIDLLGFLVKTPEREEVFDYSAIPFGSSESCLIALNSNEKVSYKDYNAINGMTIGYQEENVNIQNVLEWCEKQHIHVNMKEYRTTKAAFEAVENGDIDLALGTNYNKMDGFKIVLKILPENTYYAVKKGDKELLDELNKVMEDISLYYPTLDHNLYADYYDQKNGSQVAFSTEEVEYLNTNPVVYVYQGARSAPYEYYDKKSNAYKGIVPDILKIITANTGIRFEYVHSLDRWGYLGDTSGANKMTTFTNDFEWAVKKNVSLTQPFVDSEVSVITREPNTIIKTVASVDDQYISEQVKKHYPEYEMAYYSTQEECLRAVLDGKCDATFANSIEAEYFFNIGRFSILHEEISESLNQDVCFGITKDSDLLLTQIISKALLSISNEQCESIITDNINSSRSMGVIDLAYTNPKQLLVIVFTMLVLMLVTFIFAIKTRRAYRLIREISDKDSVTKIHNRMFFDERIGKFSKKQKGVACLYLDLNGLHELNNEKGHQRGDVMLQETADVLKELFDWNNVYRMGGDEFLVIYSDTKEDAMMKMVKTMELKFQQLSISIAYGMAYKEEVTSGQSLQELVNEADERMLENKRAYYETHDRRNR